MVNWLLYLFQTKKTVLTTTLKNDSFSYPYWHTLEDTVDKVSANSLQIVGDTLLAWLQTR